MVKDKNADQRYEYNLRITDKEREFEKLQDEERRVQHTFEQFEENMTNSFQRLQRLEEERLTQSEQRSVFSETLEKKRYIKQIISRQKEDLSQDYRSTKQVLEDGREKLQKERDELSWD